MKIFGIQIGREKKENRSYNLPFSVTSANIREGNIDATSQACIDLISSTIATMPLDLYSRSTREKRTEHYLHRVLKDPNADETRSVLFYNITKDYINGNVFIYKYYDEDGDISSLFRLNPKEVMVYRDTFNKKIFYYKNKEYDYRQILHIPSRWGYDGTVGKSIFEYAKNVFNITKEIDDYTNNAFNNSLGKRLVIDISNAFPNATEEQIEALRTKYINNYSGPDNTGKPIVKTNKVELTAIDSGLADNRANQLIENREFQEREEAKLFGVPLDLLRGKNSYGKIEELFLLFLKTGIKPIAKDFEESFGKLLSLNEREDLYFQFNYSSVVETDLATRIDTYNKQLSSGILTINEVRARENLNPVEGGDVPIISGGNFFVLNKETIDAFMAGQKLKLIEDNHNKLGDDKK